MANRDTDQSRAGTGRVCCRIGRRVVPLLVLVVAIAAGACSDPPAPDRDIVIGVIAPFATVPAARDGAILAAEEINAAGGITVGGRRERIRLIVEDGGGGPEAAVSKALKLINRDRAVALVGLPRSHNAIPVAKYVERYRVPLISTMSTHPETTAGKRWVFRMAFLDASQGRVLAELAAGDLGARRAAALIHAVSAYSAHLGEVFGDEFRRRGGQLVAYETFTEDQLDVTEQLGRIKDSGAEILLMPNDARWVELHVGAARDAGITATLLGGDTWGNENLRNCPEIRGSYFSDFWSPDRGGVRSQDFIAAYRRRFGAMPSAAAALSYDALSMVAEAVRRGGTDRETIRAAIASLEVFHGVTGTIGFRGSGDPSRSVFIRKFEEDGQIRLYREYAPQP